MNEPVTMLGLGPMGYALASAFVAGGNQTTVWNRTASRPSPDGATRIHDLTEAVTASRTVVMCLMDYDAVRSVLTPLAEPLRGRHVVNLTSGSPDAARAVAEWAATHGVSYTDGAIMTPTETIGTPSAVILHSGQPTDVLAPLGGRRTYLGADPGSAAAFDVALLDIFWSSVAGVAHAFALARSENIAPAEFAPLAHGIVDIMPAVIDEFSTRLTEGDHPGDEATVRSAAAGMAHIVETSEARGIDASLMKAAHAMAWRAVEAGHGSDGLSRMAVELERTRAQVAAPGTRR